VPSSSLAKLLSSDRISVIQRRSLSSIRMFGCGLMVVFGYVCQERFNGLTVFDFVLKVIDT
jgi:hypothetical protein